MDPYPKLNHVRPVIYEECYSSLTEENWRKYASAVCSFMRHWTKQEHYKIQRKLMFWKIQKILHELEW